MDSVLFIKKEELSNNDVEDKMNYTEIDEVVKRNSEDVSQNGTSRPRAIQLFNSALNLFRPVLW